MSFLDNTPTRLQKDPKVRLRRLSTSELGVWRGEGGLLIHLSLGRSKSVDCSAQRPWCLGRSTFFTALPPKTWVLIEVSESLGELREITFCQDQWLFCYTSGNIRKSVQFCSSTIFKIKHCEVPVRSSSVVWKWRGFFLRAFVTHKGTGY